MEQVPGSPKEPQDAPGLPGCYRHPDRETAISCTRCDRPICPDCMVSASVGFQCPECVRTGAGTGHSPRANQPRTLAGGTIAADPILITKILVVLNFAVFILALVLGDRFVDRLELIGYAYNPVLGDVVGVADGGWYRLLTATFLHQDPMHILSNMVFLWVLGRMVEPILGRGRYLAVYLLSGLGGSALAYLIAAPNQPSLGASGAVFGLIGAVAVLARRQNFDMRPVGALLVIVLLMTFLREGISWEGHIGGLVTGALVTIGLVYAPRERRNLVQYGSCALMFLVTVGIVVARTASLT